MELTWGSKDRVGFRDDAEIACQGGGCDGRGADGE